MWDWVWVTTGLVLQLVGFVISGYALWKRAQKHGAEDGRVVRAVKRGRRWLRKVLSRPQTITASAASSMTMTGQATVTRAPLEPPPVGWTVREVTDWLTLHIRRLDEQLSTQAQRRADGDRALREELEAEAEERTAGDQQALKVLDDAMTADLDHAWRGLALAAIGALILFVDYLARIIW